MLNAFTVNHLETVSRGFLEPDCFVVVVVVVMRLSPWAGYLQYGLLRYIVL
jgi:hypothetical protein